MESKGGSRRGVAAILSRIGHGGRNEAVMAEQAENQWILQGIEAARREWAAAENRFNEATVPELLDVATYQIMAERSKYEYLVRKAKERGLRF